MKRVKIENLDIFGIRPETEEEIPEDLTDLKVVAGENISITKNSETGVTTISASFTSEQQKAIDSGITSNDVTQISTNASEITNLNTNKQDKLTAGTNITIDANNVISASGGSSIKSITVSIIDLFPNPQDMSTFLQTVSSSSDAYLNAITISIPGIDNTYDEIVIDVHPITQPPYNVAWYDGTIICRKTMSTTINAMQWETSFIVNNANSLMTNDIWITIDNQGQFSWIQLVHKVIA